MAKTASINAAYLDKDMLAAIRQAYKQDKNLPTVALGRFLMPQALIELAKETGRGWKRTAIPDRYSYETRAAPPAAKELRAFAKLVTGKEPLKETAKRFGHRDYTLMHDEAVEPAGILALLFLDGWDEAWGGQIVFVKDGETIGRFAPGANTLLLVERKKGVRSFVQYVNHHAGKRTFRII